MNPDRFSTTLGDLITSKLADVHTAVPAKVTSINYGTGTASAQPLVKTAIGTSKVIPYPELQEIPLVVWSGNAGKAKATFPVKSGDIVLVIFSERDPSNFLQTSGEESPPSQKNYLGLFPIAVVPCLSTGNSTTEIHPEDIVLENDQGKISIKPDGTFLIENPSFSGEIKPDGNFIINGLTITPTGNIITKSGVDLDKFYQEYVQHFHGGVESGGSNTSPPVGV